jgi:hypothetical protein
MSHNITKTRHTEDFHKHQYHNARCYAEAADCLRRGCWQEGETKMSETPPTRQATVPRQTLSTGRQHTKRKERTQHTHVTLYQTGGS